MTAGIYSRRHPELTPEQLMREIHVVDGEGRLYAGFAGTRRMLKEVPLGFPLWLLLQLPGTDAIGRAALPLHRSAAATASTRCWAKSCRNAPMAAARCCAERIFSPSADPIAPGQDAAAVVDLVLQDAAIGFDDA